MTEWKAQKAFNRIQVSAHYHSKSHSNPTHGADTGTRTPAGDADADTDTDTPLRLSLAKRFIGVLIPTRGTCGKRLNCNVPDTFSTLSKSCSCWVKTPKDTSKVRKQENEVTILQSLAIKVIKAVLQGKNGKEPKKSDQNT